jgi:hypothetical protein
MIFYEFARNSLCIRLNATTSCCDGTVAQRAAWEHALKKQFGFPEMRCYTRSEGTYNLEVGEASI